MSATETTASGVGAPAVAPPSAAQLAARIQVPRRLPPRYDGQPLSHLSHSSYSRFALCPDDWRRRYMLGEKSAPTGSMFLGRRVDDAITVYYRQILEHGERLTVDQGVVADDQQLAGAGSMHEPGSDGVIPLLAGTLRAIEQYREVGFRRCWPGSS